MISQEKQLPEWPLSTQLFTSRTYAEHLKILIPTWAESPQMAPNHVIPCQSTIGLTHAGHFWHGQSNTPYPSHIRFASHPAQLPNCLPTNSSQNGKNDTIHAKYLPVHLDQTSPFWKQLRRSCLLNLRTSVVIDVKVIYHL